MESNHPVKRDKYYFLFQSMWQLFFGALLIPVYLYFGNIYSTWRSYKGGIGYDPTGELSFLIMKYVIGFSAAGLLIIGIANMVRFVIETKKI